MKGNIVETIIGTLVLAVALSFVVYAYGVVGTRNASGYEVSARFDRVDGLSLGADVRLSGIKVGAVTAMTLDGETYEALVVMTLNSSVKLYDGTAAKITSAGLLGNQYISLDPGGGRDALTEGSKIEHTSGSVDLSSLISKFVFRGGGDEPAQDKK